MPNFSNGYDGDLDVVEGVNKHIRYQCYGNHVKSLGPCSIECAGVTTQAVCDP